MESLIQSFDLQYNDIVNKDKNLFYFENYCLDTNEFKEWLKHNKLNYFEYEDLSESLKSVYLEYKAEYIENLFDRYTNLYNKNKNIIYLRRLYDMYLCEKSFIKILKQDNGKFQYIYNFFKTNRNMLNNIWYHNAPRNNNASAV